MAMPSGNGNKYASIRMSDLELIRGRLEDARKRAHTVYLEADPDTINELHMREVDLILARQIRNLTTLIEGYPHSAEGDILRRRIEFAEAAPTTS